MSSLGRGVRPVRERRLDLQRRTLTMRLMSDVLPDGQTGSKMQTDGKKGEKTVRMKGKDLKETTFLFHRLKLSVFTTLLAGLLAASIVDSLHGRFFSTCPLPAALTSTTVTPSRVSEP